jgi:hypothetical protein
MNTPKRAYRRILEEPEDIDIYASYDDEPEEPEEPDYEPEEREYTSEEEQRAMDEAEDAYIDSLIKEDE